MARFFLPFHHHHSSFISFSFHHAQLVGASSIVAVHTPTTPAQKLTFQKKELSRTKLLCVHVLEVMAKWQRKLTRLGLLLLLCYVATLLQLSRLRHADTAHHKEQSSRLPNSGTSSTRRLPSSMKNITPEQRYRMQQQRQQRRQRAEEAQQQQLSSSHRNAKTVLQQQHHHALHNTTGHLYLCIKSSGQHITLPRVPNFIIGGKPKKTRRNKQSRLQPFTRGTLCVHHCASSYFANPHTIHQAPKRVELQHS